MNIKKLMNTKVVTCRPTDTLNVAAQLMWEHDCGALPVVDDEGRIVGLITDRDICMAGYIQGSPLHAISVSDTMSKEVFSCQSDEPVEVAELLMTDNQIRRIPVADGDNRPIGMVSLSDIARHAALSQEKKGLLQVSQTLAAICQPRLQAQDLLSITA
jgi:CBS domain-containing protein